MSTKRIAIIGAGLAGLAAAWHLSSISTVTLFEETHIGAGASGIAAGLMHPFSGAQANLNLHGFEGMAATHRLIREIEKETNTSLNKSSGLLRSAVTPFQQKHFATCAARFPDVVEWWPEEKCVAAFPSLVKAPGIYIPSALKIDCPDYLRLLWTACQNQGVLLEKMKVDSLNNLKDFDAIIVAAGAFSALYPELSKYTMTQVKGQLLELKLPENTPRLPFALSSGAYLVNHSYRSTFYAGSTYEKGFASNKADSVRAKELILPKLCSIIPSCLQSEVLDCQAGIRVSTPDHLPIAEKVKDHIWILTGFGSKGLLYHALYAKRIANALSQELGRG